MDADASAKAEPQSLTPHAKKKKSPWPKRVRQGLLIALLLLGAAGAVFTLRPRAVPADVAKSTRGPLEVAIEESGVTRIKDHYLVSAPVVGRVSRSTLEPGDMVHEGDTLAEIAPAQSPLLDERTRAEAEGRASAATSALDQARAQIARATVAKEAADHELARLTTLAESAAITRQAVEQAEFDARLRKEELTSALFAAKVATEDARAASATLKRDGDKGASRHVDVLAPCSGRVLRVHQKSAGLVQAGAPLVEVGDPAALEVVVDLLTTDAVNVAAGTPVVLQAWGGDHPIAGRVRLVEPSAFTRPSALGVDEQRVNVIIVVTDPRDRFSALGDGYRIEARLVLWKAADVLRVPQGAVFRHGDAFAVFRMQDGIARLTPVTVGHRGESEVEILQGLEAGATVVVHPGDRIKDGVKLEPR